LCKGKDGENVKERELPKSIGCGKNFRGKEKLNTKKKVEGKLENLVEELVERLEEDRDDYCRVATGLTVGIVMENIGQIGHSSRAGPLQMYSTTSVFSTVMGILIRHKTSTDKEFCQCQHISKQVYNKFKLIKSKYCIFFHGIN